MFVKMRMSVALFLSLAILLSACSACCAGENFAAPSVREVLDELARAERALGLQTELPLAAAEADEPGLRWRLGISAETARYVLYGVLLSFLAMMLFLTPANLWSFSRARRVRAAGETAEAVRDGIARMARSGREADELAHIGDYAEAMHLLLLESVAELSLRAGMTISESLTSREILRRASLSNEGTTAFADIVSRVEVSYYGLYHPGADDYAACRHSFETLRAALAGGSR